MLKFRLALALVFALIVAAPVLASTITGATNQGVITVSSNGTAPSANVTVSFSVNTTTMISSGYLTSDVLNSAVLDSSTDVAYMPTASAWWLFLPTMANSSSRSLSLYTGGTTMGSKLRYFPGASGMSTADHALLEPGGNFTVEMKGWVNTSTWENILNKSGAFNIATGNATGAGKIIVTLAGAGTTVAANPVASGEHTITVAANSTNLTLTIDGVLADTKPLLAGVTNNANAWVSCTNSVMPYLEYQKIWVGGNLRQNVAWQYAATFTDQSGNGRDATPTFLSSGSSTNITATLASFQPVTQAKVTSYTIGSTGTILSGSPDMPSQMYTEGDYSKIPGADIANEFIDAGGYPRALFWYPLIYGVIIVLGLMFYPVTSGGNRSVVMQCVITEALLSLVGAMNPVPLVSAFLFPVAAIAIISSQKHTNIG